MYPTLSPSAIRLHAKTLDHLIPLAPLGGFDGLEVNATEVAALVAQHSAAPVAAMFSDVGLRPAGWSLPFNWRGAEEEWQQGLAALSQQAQAAASIGATRTFTWIMPGSNDLPFKDNWRFHVERLKPVADILAQHGCRLGLEYVGPKTTRDTFKHPFIFTQAAMLQLADECGPNVGLLLDCWHWYTSHGTLDDLHALTNEQIIYVHINDAPAGIAVDEQQDLVRELPGATGVIDIASFVDALRAMRYDGPIVAEPFKASLAELPSDEERVRVVGAAVRGVMDI